MTSRCSWLTPVMTSSCVCGSCVTFNVGSSSAILCRLAEIFCSSPRVFGSTASPNIGVGKLGSGSLRRMVRVGDRVADVQVLDLGDRDDVARPDLVNLRSVLPLGFEEVPDREATGRCGGSRRCGCAGACRRARG